MITSAPLTIVAARRRARAFGALLALAAACACSSTGSVKGTLLASPQLNASASRRPSPLQLRLYELKSAASFDDADFVSLYEHDQTVLGTDLVNREEITLLPGQTRPWNRTLSAETRFVGVVAAYRDLDHARWRAVVPVRPGKQTLTITADALAVDVSVKH